MKRVILWVLLCLLALPEICCGRAAPAARQDAAWQARWESNGALVKQNSDWDVLLIGGSLVQGWETTGKEAWSRNFPFVRTLNLGYEGDQVENMIWRIDNGEAKGVSPKVIFVTVSNANLGDSLADAVQNIRGLMWVTCAHFPKAHVVLTPVFPQGASPDDPRRLFAENVNRELAILYPNQYLDFNDRFLSAGFLSEKLIGNDGQLSAAGYQIWAKAIRPTIEKEVPYLCPISGFDFPVWANRYSFKREETESGPCDAVLIGDSITHSWETTGKEIMKKYFSDYKIVNLGYWGQRAEHAQWHMINNNPIDKCKPKLAFVMIGSNNINAGHAPEDAAAGIKALLGIIRQQSPETKIVLTATTPRGDDEKKQKLQEQLNEITKGFADGKTIVWLDFTQKLLSPEGKVTKEMAYDLRHPSEKGHEIWAQAMLPFFENVKQEGGKQ